MHICLRFTSVFQKINVQNIALCVHVLWCHVDVTWWVFYITPRSDWANQERTSSNKYSSEHNNKDEEVSSKFSCILELSVSRLVSQSIGQSIYNNGAQRGASQSKRLCEPSKILKFSVTMTAAAFIFIYGSEK